MKGNSQTYSGAISAPATRFVLCCKHCFRLLIELKYEHIHTFIVFHQVTYDLLVYLLFKQRKTSIDNQHK